MDIRTVLDRLSERIYELIVALGDGDTAPTKREEEILRRLYVELDKTTADILGECYVVEPLRDEIAD